MNKDKASAGLRPQEISAEEYGLTQREVLVLATWKTIHWCFAELPATDTHLLFNRG